jgi:hypothetical protein
MSIIKRRRLKSNGGELGVTKTYMLQVLKYSERLYYKSK